VEPTGARSVDEGRLAKLDDHHVNARQRQLAGKHQPRWPAADNDNIVFVLRTHALESTHKVGLRQAHRRLGTVPAAG
jgi:hypothetical protein